MMAHPSSSACQSAEASSSSVPFLACQLCQFPIAASFQPMAYHCSASTSETPATSSASVVPTSSQCCLSATEATAPCKMPPKLASSAKMARQNFPSLLMLPFWRLLPLLFGALLLLPSSVGTALIVPRSSCRAHLLNGEGHTSEAVLPIRSPSGNIFWLLCRFPPTLSSQSARLSVQTVVHNALVGQWLAQPEGINAENDDGKVIGIEQQVSEGKFLHSLMAKSDDCQQQMRIRWPNKLYDNGTQTDQQQKQELIIETFNGKSISVRRNLSRSGSFEERVPVPSPPLIRLHVPLPRGVQISLEPLTCRNMVISRPECHFELRTDSDSVRLRLDALRKKFPQGILSFSFRTGRPNGRLLELGSAASDHAAHGTSSSSSGTGVDLIDGYLLLANHIVHPVRLLADGAWHSLNLDLHSLALRVDGQGTAISLVGGGSPVPAFDWMDILLVGEVGALRVDEANFGHNANDENGDDDGQWLCRNGRANGDETFLDFRLPSMGTDQQHKHIFGPSPVCANEQHNFCNCKGPNSALSHGARKKTAECAVSVSAQNAFHLSRVADRLAFFIVPNFGPRFPISVLLQSEEPTGLVFFGVYTLPAPAFGELGGRVQVHFVADTVYGAFCSSQTDGTERCLSCAIRRPKAFPSADWVRFSLFHQQNLQFLAVDRQICLLSPNSDAVDAAELYKITETNVLFVGGTFYAKIGAGIAQRLSESFRRQFQDNTREKAPSIQGCVAEIVVKGQQQRMDALLEAQKWQASRAGSNSGGDQMFAVRKGCADCAPQCKGAPCFRAEHAQQKNECQCGQIYATKADSYGQRCEWTTDKQNAVVPLPHKPLSVPIRHPSAPRGRRPMRLDKVWALLRMPEANLEMSPFLRIGGVQIAVGDNGQRLVVEAPDYAIREEFIFRQKLDSRLHLLSLEILPSVGTGYAASALAIRLDNDRRKFFGFAEIPIASTENVQIGRNLTALPEGKSIVSASESGTESAGCVAALVFHYVPSDEGVSSGSEQMLLPFHQQVDYVPLLHHHDDVRLNRQNGTVWWANADGVVGGKCGANFVIDPTLWESNATSWGRILLMDRSKDLFDGQISSLFGHSATWATRLSLLITAALITFILVSLLLYGFVAFNRRRQDLCKAQNCKVAKNCGFAKQIDQRMTKHAEEKRPLRSNEEDEEDYGKSSQKQHEQHTSNSHGATKNGAMRMNGAEKFANEPQAESSGVLHESDNERQNEAMGLVVHQLDGSPKHNGVRDGTFLSLSRNDDRDTFVATPLLQQRRRVPPTTYDENDGNTSNNFSQKYCSNLSPAYVTKTPSWTNGQRQNDIYEGKPTAIRVPMINGANSSSFVADVRDDSLPLAWQHKQCQRQNGLPSRSPSAPIATKDEL